MFDQPSRTVKDSDSLAVVAAPPCASDRARDSPTQRPVWQKAVNPSRPPVQAQLGSLSRPARPESDRLVLRGPSAASLSLSELGISPDHRDRAVIGGSGIRVAR
jgi:hypothetical protein